MQKIIKELERIVGKDYVLKRKEELIPYECDSLSFFKEIPKTVVFPSCTNEVSEILKIASREGIPVVPRGSGTGLSGGATPTPGSIVISLARMDKIFEINKENMFAHVEAGVINQRLNNKAKKLGLMFAPDPASQKVSTLGGNAAENAGGPHCFKYGVMVNHVLGLKAVLPDGEIVELGKPGLEPTIDIRGLFIGSEGTLGIVTELYLKLIPIPDKVSTILAVFSSLKECFKAVSEIVARGIVPCAMEILDKRAIDTVEASVLRAGYPKGAEAVLIVELDGRKEEIEKPEKEVIEILKKINVLDIKFAKDDIQREKLWKGRKGVFGASGRLAPDLYVMDGVVPRKMLPTAIEEVQRICEKHGVICTNIAHAGDGNLHPNICYDIRDEKQTKKAEEAGKEIIEMCIKLGGTITGEHGVGIEKKELMNLLFPRSSLQVMRRIKALFDPGGIANPGKLIPEEK